MKLLSLFLALIFGISASAEMATPPSVEASVIYRTAASAATSLLVFEGLPHPMSEKQALETESKRKDTKKLLLYMFYTPGADARNAEEIRKLLSNPAGLAVYRGPKGCGGFHPDYSISWQAGETSHYALICFGCGEIVFYDGKTSLRYDLPKDTLAKYKELLAVHEAKRPKPVKK
jgi:hypothetical protein